MTNCANVTPARSRELRRRDECRRPIARQAEDEGSEHVDAVLAEGLQPLDEGLAREIEPLVDVFQSFRRDRLDADQRAADVRTAHSLEELASSAASMVICV